MTDDRLRVSESLARALYLRGALDPSAITAAARTALAACPEDGEARVVRAVFRSLLRCLATDAAAHRDVRIEVQAALRAATIELLAGSRAPDGWHALRALAENCAAQAGPPPAGDSAAFCLFEFHAALVTPGPDGLPVAVRAHRPPDGQPLLGAASCARLPVAPHTEARRRLRHEPSETFR